MAILKFSDIMKKIFLSVIAVLILFSCEDHRVHDVALQALINDNFFSADDARAEAGENSVVIRGFTQDETLSLQLSGFREGNFQIGPGRSSSAVFEDFTGNIYTTGSNGTGVVEITKIDEAGRTLTGNFYFTAFWPGLDTIYVSKGVFYEVPFTGGTTGIPGEGNSFFARVNGDPFEPVTVMAANTGNSVAISANAPGEEMTLTMPVRVESGTYSLTGSGFSAKYETPDGLQEAVEGQLEVTEHNPETGTVKGEFHFTTSESEITEGEFEVTYS